MANYTIIDETTDESVSRKFRSANEARRGFDAVAARYPDPGDLLIVCIECGWDVDDCDDGTDDHEEHHRVLRRWKNRK